MLHTDEINAWIQMLERVEAILPCPLCQKHYKEWKQANPLSVFLTKKSGRDFHDAAVGWLWRLHNSINVQRDVPTISLEDAETKYGKQDLQQALEKLLEVLEQAKLQRQIDGMYTHEWRKKLAFLRKILMV
jgi:hypothetical protein